MKVKSIINFVDGSEGVNRFPGGVFDVDEARGAYLINLGWAVEAEQPKRRKRKEASKCTDQ